MFRGASTGIHYDQGSKPAMDIDGVLSAAAVAAAGGVRITLTAVDVRDDAQVARACQMLWGASTRKERAVDCVFNIRSTSTCSRDDVAAVTETDIAQEHARGCCLAHAVLALSPRTFTTISPIVDNGSSSLVGHAMQDAAVAHTISQQLHVDDAAAPPRVCEVHVTLPVTALQMIELLAAAESSSSTEDTEGFAHVLLSTGASVEGAALSLGVRPGTVLATLVAATVPTAVVIPTGPTPDDVQRRVCAAAALVLNTQEGALPLEPSTSLWDMGMNSVLAVSLAAALEAEFSVSLPASVAFDYGTLKDLVRPLFDPSLTHQLESPRSQSSL
jgi:acyl carrier protein